MRQRGRGCGRRASAARRILYTARMVTAPKPDPANFRLSVKDFGPIVEADVDFRPLTVFVGPSNTGKSYLSMLTYALHQGLMNEPISPQDQLRSTRFQRLSKEMTEGDTDNIQKWMNTMGSIEGENALENEVEKVLQECVKKGISGSRSEINFQISRCFGISSTHHLLRRKHSRKDAILNLSRTDMGVEFSMPLSPPQTTPDISIRRSITFPVSEQGLEPVFQEIRMLPPNEQRRAVTIIGTSIINEIISHIAGAAANPIYYLPANRTGIMDAYNVIVGSLINRVQYRGIHGKQTGVLSGVLGDFLQHIGNPDNFLHNSESKIANYANKIEEKVLYGEIIIDQSETGNPLFFYRPERWKDNLSLMNASSMVSEIAPIVLFLRYIVQDNDVLIIEEPESHLHPAMQVEFTRVLAGAVKAGLRVILTTHSEWVVETIGNLVELSKVPKARRERLDGGPYALRPDDVGVWLFRQKKRPRGSVVEEVRHDPETGVYGVEYDDVAMALHNEWASAANANE